MSQSRIRPHEELARAQLQRLLGVPVEHHDDGSSAAMYDLRIRGADGNEAAEVVADVDPRKRARMAAGKRLPPSIMDRRLRRAWTVAVANQARVNEVENRLIATLVWLESEGVQSVYAREESVASQRLLDAHLESATVDPAGPAGRVHVFAGLSEVGNPVPAEGLTDYVTSFLTAHDDIRTRLEASGAKKTHAVILVSTDRTDVLWALDDDEDALPTRDPDVPHEISDVWLMPLWPGDRVLRWSRGGSWCRAGLMPRNM